MPKAIILLSGGIDSTVCLAMAQSAGFQCYALTLNYGQRNQFEIAAAKKIAEQLGAVEHKVLNVPINDWGGSALTDKSLTVPEAATVAIPATYVPARNTIFLSLALGWAEVVDASAIFYGANQQDDLNYPDCRQDYVNAFTTMANLATKSGVTGKPLTIETPLIAMSKIDIIQTGLDLGVDYSLTQTCYNPKDGGVACNHCDACRLRQAAFNEITRI